MYWVIWHSAFDPRTWRECRRATMRTFDDLAAAERFAYFLNLAYAEVGVGDYVALVVLSDSAPAFVA